MEWPWVRDIAYAAGGGSTASWSSALWSKLHIDDAESPAEPSAPAQTGP